MFKNVKSVFHMIFWPCIVLIFIVLTTRGGVQEPQGYGPKYGESSRYQTVPVYRFGFHAIYAPDKMIQIYQPLIDYLNERLTGGRLQLEASLNFTVFEEKYKAGKSDFVLLNPWQALQAMKAGYSVIAQAGDPKDFKGLFIVRKDGGIEKPSDLKGKSVSYPSSTAVAACIMLQYYLRLQGIDVGRDIENRYVGTQEYSIMNAYSKKTAAGGTWTMAWKNFQKLHPKEAAEMKVAWETEPFLVSNSVMARGDIPADIREQVQKLLTGLHETDRGKAILSNIEIDRFLPASDKDYHAVQTYIDRFEKEVRKVEIK